jgi:peroxiredoxin
MKRILIGAGIASALAGLLSLVAINVVSAQGAGMSSDNPALSGVSIGAMAPEFRLTDTEGRLHTLSDYLEDDSFVVLEWFNPACPYVRKYHSAYTSNTSLDEALAFARAHDVTWLAVNSNPPGSLGGGLEHNRWAIEAYNIDYPVLLDTSGEIGMAYGAQNTPQFFIINDEGRIVYSGGLDESVLYADEPEENYLVTAMSQAFMGEEVSPAITPNLGCSVKYAKLRAGM